MKIKSKNVNMLVLQKPYITYIVAFVFALLVPIFSVISGGIRAGNDLYYAITMIFGTPLVVLLLFTDEKTIFDKTSGTMRIQEKGIFRKKVKEYKINDISEVRLYYSRRGITVMSTLGVMVGLEFVPIYYAGTQFKALVPQDCKYGGFDLGNEIAGFLSVRFNQIETDKDYI